MLLLPLLLPTATMLSIDRLVKEESYLLIEASSRQQEARCPSCQTLSRRIHSRYQRSVSDLPWSDTAIKLRLSVPRFYCDNADCPRRTFSQSLDTFIDRYQRRTRRQSQALQAYGFALGGQAAARLATRLGIEVSGDTILRTIRRYQLPADGELSAIGVDDWAYRRGQRYGTLIVDLISHRPVDLLPDRDSESLAHWLQQRPSIRVISRDRAEVYADAARQGAPQATQVVDRWHLLKNVRELVERVLQHHADQIKKTAQALAENEPKPIPQKTTTESTPTRSELEQQQRRARRLARYQEVVILHQQGLSIRAIAQRLRMHRRTVRLWIHAPCDQRQLELPGNDN